MFEAADGFLFDLADALTGEVEFVADFFEGKWCFAVKAVEHADDFAFTRGEAC